MASEVFAALEAVICDPKWDIDPDLQEGLGEAIAALFTNARGPSGTIYCSSDEPVWILTRGGGDDTDAGGTDG